MFINNDSYIPSSLGILRPASLRCVVLLHISVYLCFIIIVTIIDILYVILIIVTILYYIHYRILFCCFLFVHRHALLKKSACEALSSAN